MRNRRREAVALARWRIVDTALREGISQAARAHECARSTVPRVLRRDQQGGLWALCNQPRGCREPMAAEVRELIVELKLAPPGRSTEKLRPLRAEAGLPVSRQTVWRVLAERGLARLEEREPRVRFVRAAPTDRWQMDLLEDKKVTFGKVHLVAALGIRAAFAAPYKPRCKGKIERFFSFFLRDFLGEVRNQVTSLEELNAKLETWLEWYNWRRPHSSLGQGTPAQHYRGSQRAAPPELESLLAVEISRRVDRSSTIPLRGLRLAVPPEYLGKKVWLQHLGDQLTIRANNRIIAKYSVSNL